MKMLVTRFTSCINDMFFYFSITLPMADFDEFVAF